MLELTDISVRFGGLKALDQVTVKVREGDIHGLIGPNGAGKTTLFNVISGIQPPTEGRIDFRQQPITHLPLAKRAAKGISRTFQNIRLFPDMTVLENVMSGMHLQLPANALLALLHVGAGRREEDRCRQRCRELLSIVGLDGVAAEQATSLSYGHQRRVEIARALASDPQLLLLDEPAAGMNPAETEELSGLFRRLKANGLTLVIVEHDLHFLMKLSDRLTVLDFGKVLADGDPHTVRNDPQVIEAYLGSSGQVQDRITA
jgi:branched-chain amino acid transport system ATP-binding protein